MSKSKHTPGHLAVFPTGAVKQFNVTRVEGSRRPPDMEWDDYYVEFSGYFGSQGPHVFAAAPELLEALRISLYAVTEIDNSHKSLRTIRAALAKAEGRS